METVETRKMTGKGSDAGKEVFFQQAKDNEETPEKRRSQDMLPYSNHSQGVTKTVGKVTREMRKKGIDAVKRFITKLDRKKTKKPLSKDVLSSNDNPQGVTKTVGKVAREMRKKGIDAVKGFVSKWDEETSEKTRNEDVVSSISYTVNKEDLPSGTQFALPPILPVPGPEIDPQSHEKTHRRDSGKRHEPKNESPPPFPIQLPLLLPLPPPLVPYVLPNAYQTMDDLHRVPIPPANTQTQRPPNGTDRRFQAFQAPRTFTSRYPVGRNVPRPIRPDRLSRQPSTYQRIPRTKDAKKCEQIRETISPARDECRDRNKCMVCKEKEICSRCLEKRIYKKLIRLMLCQPNAKTNLGNLRSEQRKENEKSLSSTPCVPTPACHVARSLGCDSDQQPQISINDFHSEINHLRKKGSRHILHCRLPDQTDPAEKNLQCSTINKSTKKNCPLKQRHRVGPSDACSVDKINKHSRNGCSQDTIRQIKTQGFQTIQFSISHEKSGLKKKPLCLNFDLNDLYRFIDSRVGENTALLGNIGHETNPGCDCPQRNLIEEKNSFPDIRRYEVRSIVTQTVAIECSTQTSLNGAVVGTESTVNCQCQCQLRNCTDGHLKYKHLCQPQSCTDCTDSKVGRESDKAKSRLPKRKCRQENSVRNLRNTDYASCSNEDIKFRSKSKPCSSKRLTNTRVKLTECKCHEEINETSCSGTYSLPEKYREQNESSGYSHSTHKQRLGNTEVLEKLKSIRDCITCSQNMIKESLRCAGENEPKIGLSSSTFREGKSLNNGRGWGFKSWRIEREELKDKAKVSHQGSLSKLTGGSHTTTECKSCRANEILSQIQIRDSMNCDSVTKSKTSFIKPEYFVQDSCQGLKRQKRSMIKILDQNESRARHMLTIERHEYVETVVQECLDSENETSEDRDGFLPCVLHRNSVNDEINSSDSNTSTETYYNGWKRSLKDPSPQSSLYFTQDVQKPCKESSTHLSTSYFEHGFYEQSKQDELMDESVHEKDVCGSFFLPASKTWEKKETISNTNDENKRENEFLYESEIPQSYKKQLGENSISKKRQTEYTTEFTSKTSRPCKGFIERKASQARANGSNVKSDYPKENNNVCNATPKYTFTNNHSIDGVKNSGSNLAETFSNNHFDHPVPGYILSSDTDETDSNIIFQEMTSVSPTPEAEDAIISNSYKEKVPPCTNPCWCCSGKRQETTSSPDSNLSVSDGSVKSGDISACLHSDHFYRGHERTSRDSRPTRQGKGMYTQGACTSHEHIIRLRSKTSSCDTPNTNRKNQRGQSQAEIKDPCSQSQKENKNPCCDPRIETENSYFNSKAEIKDPYCNLELESKDSYCQSQIESKDSYCQSQIESKDPCCNSQIESEDSYCDSICFNSMAEIKDPYCNSELETKDHYYQSGKKSKLPHCNTYAEIKVPCCKSKSENKDLYCNSQAESKESHCKSRAGSKDPNCYSELESKYPYCNSQAESKESNCKSRAESKDPYCKSQLESKDPYCNSQAESKNSYCKSRVERKDPYCKSQLESKDPYCNSQAESKNSYCKSRAERKDPYCKSQLESEDPYCNSEAESKESHCKSRAERKDPYCKSQLESEDPYCNSEAESKESHCKSRAERKDPYCKSQLESKDPYCNSQAESKNSYCKSRVERKDPYCKSQLESEDPYCNSEAESKESHCKSRAERKDPYCKSQLESKDPYCNSQAESKNSYCKSQAESKDPYCKSQLESKDPYCNSLAESKESHCKSRAERKDPYCKSQLESKDPYCNSQAESKESNYKSRAESKGPYCKSQLKSKDQYCNSQAESKEWYCKSRAESKDPYCYSQLESKYPYCNSQAESKESYCKSRAERKDPYCKSQLESKEPYCNSQAESKNSYCKSRAERNDPYCKSQLESKEPYCNSQAESKDSYCKSRAESKDLYCKSLLESQDPYCKSQLKSKDPHCNSQAESKDSYCKSRAESKDPYCKSQSKSKDPYCNSQAERKYLYYQSRTESKDPCCNSVVESKDTYCKLRIENKEPYCNSQAESKDSYSKSRAESKDPYCKSQLESQDPYCKSQLESKDPYCNSQAESKDSYCKSWTESKEPFCNSQLESKDSYYNSQAERKDLYYQSRTESNDPCCKPKEESKDQCVKSQTERKDPCCKPQEESKDQCGKSQTERKNPYCNSQAKNRVPDCKSRSESNDSYCNSEAEIKGPYYNSQLESKDSDCRIRTESKNPCCKPQEESKDQCGKSQTERKDPCCKPQEESKDQCGKSQTERKDPCCKPQEESNDQYGKSQTERKDPRDKLKTESNNPSAKLQTDHCCKSHTESKDHCCKSQTESKNHCSKSKTESNDQCCRTQTECKDNCCRTQTECKDHCRTQTECKDHCCRTQTECKDHCCRTQIVNDNESSLDTESQISSLEYQDEFDEQKKNEIPSVRDETWCEKQKIPSISSQDEEVDKGNDVKDDPKKSNECISKDNEMTSIVDPWCSENCFKCFEDISTDTKTSQDEIDNKSCQTSNCSPDPYLDKKNGNTPSCSQSCNGITSCYGRSGVTIATAEPNGCGSTSNERDSECKHKKSTSCVTCKRKFCSSCSQFCSTVYTDRKRNICVTIQKQKQRLLELEAKIDHCFKDSRNICCQQNPIKPRMKNDSYKLPRQVEGNKYSDRLSREYLRTKKNYRDETKRNELVRCSQHTTCLQTLQDGTATYKRVLNTDKDCLQSKQRLQSNQNCLFKRSKNTRVEESGSSSSFSCMCSPSESFAENVDDFVHKNSKLYPRCDMESTYVRMQHSNTRDFFESINQRCAVMRNTLLSSVAVNRSKAVRVKNKPLMK